MPWLVREGEVLASAEVADGRRRRAQGLLGRRDFEGALILRPCRSVHTVGMRFPLDVAFCDRSGRVLRTVTLRPWRVSRVVWRAGFAVEAQAGTFARWDLRTGHQVEIKQ